MFYSSKSCLKVCRSVWKYLVTLQWKYSRMYSYINSKHSSHIYMHHQRWTEETKVSERRETSLTEFKFVISIWGLQNAFLPTAFIASALNQCVQECIIELKDVMILKKKKNLRVIGIKDGYFIIWNMFFKCLHEYEHFSPTSSGEWDDENWLF